jgi:DNA-3-methyladenine glycosylase I
MTGQRLAAGLVHHPDGLARCWWAGADSLYVAYHDEEWGTPVTEDRRLFEKICLEGFQAGLSWLTILRKRASFREAFAGFDIDRVARFGARDVARLLKDERIVRHRGKIESAINNAKCAAALRDEFGSLAAYFWHWEPDARSRPRRLTKGALMQLAATPASAALSKDMKRRGWTFVGTDHRLRLHAGDGARQRSPRGVRQAHRRRGRARGAPPAGRRYSRIAPARISTSSSTRISTTMSSRKWPRAIDACSTAKR